MIASRTPLRISFVGGGTDLPDFYEEHGGAVVSTTIDKWIHVIVAPRFEGDRARQLFAAPRSWTDADRRRARARARGDAGRRRPARRRDRHARRRALARHRARLFECRHGGRAERAVRIPGLSTGRRSASLKRRPGSRSRYSESRSGAKTITPPQSAASTSSSSCHGEAA